MRYILFSILLVISLGAGAQQPTALDKDLNYAKYLVDNGKSDFAYSTLNQIIKKHPSCARAYYIRAINYYNDGNTKSAIADIDLAIKRQPRAAEYHSLKGQILYMAQKFSQSGDCFVQSFRLSDTLMSSCYYAARAFCKAEDYDKAESWAAKYIDAYPDCDSAKFLMSEILSCSGDPVGALRIINSMETKGADFYRLRGIAYCKSELYEYSLADLNKALDLNPKLVDIYLWRGLANCKAGNKQAAKADWNTALKFRLYKANDYLEKYRLL